MATSLARGQRVGDRYRLERELGSGADGVTWEAIDERLDRPVAVRLFSASLDRTMLMKRAGRAASLTHPRVVRVFDTGEDAGHFFTVSELLPSSLRSARLPLQSDAALQHAAECAEALHYAHDRGVVHGNIQETNILLSEGGAKVGDFALNRSSEHATKDDDLRQFGALLRRVCRDSDPTGPQGMAAVIDGLADGAYASAGEALTDLRALAPKPLDAGSTEQRWRGRGFIVIVIALLLGLAAFGAMRLGEQSPRERLLPGGRIVGAPLPIVGSNDYDPFGDDKAEGAATVPNAIDGNSETFWSTERYASSPDFSGLKDGVGLIFDLGKPVEIGKTQILFAAQGCSFEIKHSDDKNAPVGEWGTAAAIGASPLSAALEFDRATARFFMLWITKLTSGTPGAEAKFACAVKEVDFYSP